MEATAEVKPLIWKATKMFWFDHETSETERNGGYPLVVRQTVVFALRDNNKVYIANMMFWSNYGGHSDESEAREKIETAIQRTLPMAVKYCNPEPSMTDEEFETEFEEQRMKYSGTYFKETDVPPMIENAANAEINRRRKVRRSEEEKHEA